jgi:hypothetical protein
VNNSCTVGEEVRDMQTIRMPAIKERGEHGGEGGPDTGEAEYRLIRTKVPVKIAPFFTNI